MSDDTLSHTHIKISWLFGTAAAFLIFVIIGVYSGRMTRDYTDYDQDRAAQRYATLAKLRLDESILINPVDKSGNPTAEWIDQAKGTVRIPIEEAMMEEVDALKTKPVVIGMVIPGTIPAPAPAPAAPAAPAAKPSEPAKPAMTDKPVKTTLVTPGVINQPVFNTRKTNAQPAGTQAFKGYIEYGNPIAVAASSVPTVQTNE